MLTVVLLFLVSFAHSNHSHDYIVAVEYHVWYIRHIYIYIHHWNSWGSDNTIITSWVCEWVSEWVQCVMCKWDKKPLNNCLVHSRMCCVCSGVRGTPLERHWTVPVGVEIPCTEGDGVVPTQRRLIPTWSKLCCELNWRPLAHSTQILYDNNLNAYLVISICS